MSMIFNVFGRKVSVEKNLTALEIPKESAFGFLERNDKEEMPPLIGWDINYLSEFLIFVGKFFHTFFPSPCHRTFSITAVSNNITEMESTLKRIETISSAFTYSHIKDGWSVVDYKSPQIHFIILFITMDRYKSFYYHRIGTDKLNFYLT